MCETTPFLEQWKKDVAALEKRLFEQACGFPTKRRETTLAVRGGAFVSLEVDDTGKVIEPCRKCGPVIMCSDCASRLA